LRFVEQVIFWWVKSIGIQINNGRCSLLFGGRNDTVCAGCCHIPHFVICCFIVCYIVVCYVVCLVVDVVVIDVIVVLLILLVLIILNTVIVKI
jgi:hypothetical protein